MICKKETLATVFSGEFCKIVKNTFFYITPQVTTSENMENHLIKLCFVLSLYLIILTIVRYLAIVLD